MLDRESAIAKLEELGFNVTRHEDGIELTVGVHDELLSEFVKLMTLNENF